MRRPPNPQPTFSAWHADVIERLSGLIAALQSPPPSFLPSQAIIAMKEMEHVTLLLNDAMADISHYIRDVEEAA